AAANRRALVQRPQPVLLPAGAAAGRAGRRPAAAVAAAWAPRGPVPADAIAGVPGLQRAGDQYLAERDPARHQHPRGRRAAAEPGFHPGGDALHHPHHPGLYRLQLLGVPGQGQGGGGLPLMPGSPGRHWLRRVGWLVLLWAASVGTLGVVAWLIRRFMNAAGMTA